MYESQHLKDAIYLKEKQLLHIEPEWSKFKKKKSKKKKKMAASLSSNKF